MAGMSDYLETKILDHLFRSTTYTPPTVIALALCTSTPVDEDTGDLTGKEVTGGNYARVSIGRGDANWAAVGLGYTSNIEELDFPQASTNWTGPITHVAILDDTTIGAGNLLFYGELIVPKSVSTGDIFKFNPNQLIVKIDN